MSLRPAHLLAVVALALAGSPPGRALAQPAGSARDVLIVGSSSVNGAAGRTIESELARLGLEVRRRSRGASGLARPDFYDWDEQVPELAPLDRYALVIVMLGGNDVQSLRADDGGWIRWQDEAAWTEEYTSRVTRFVDGLCRAGAPRVVMLLPANGGRPRWSERIMRVRRSQGVGARESSCGVAIDPGADTLEAHDGVHLTRRGAQRMWARIEDPIRLLLGLDQPVTGPSGDVDPPAR